MSALRRSWPQIVDDLSERPARDELHGVEVDAALATNEVDRHDVLVAEVCRRLGLVPKALELAGIQGRGEGEDFESYPAAERDLHGLVNNAHAAAADLAHDAEVAQGGLRLN